jgi:hypothetical protein
MALSNQHTDCDVLNLDPHDPRGGPFLVTQKATAPDDPRQLEDLYLLRHDGAWVEFATHALMPEAERVSALFDSLGDIVRLMEDLPPQPTVIRNGDLDPAKLGAFLHQVEAGGGMLAIIRSQVAQYKAQRAQTGA